MVTTLKQESTCDSKSGLEGMKTFLTSDQHYQQVPKIEKLPAIYPISNAQMSTSDQHYQQVPKVVKLPATYLISNALKP